MISLGIRPWMWGAAFVIALLSFIYGASWAAHARDNGRYANNPLKPWFDTLKSKKGFCCSDADGRKLDDPEWEFNGHGYRVKIGGDWYVVPDEAVITEANKAGYAMVWPVRTGSQVQIICFLPGSAI